MPRFDTHELVAVPAHTLTSLSLRVHRKPVENRCCACKTLHVLSACPSKPSHTSTIYKLST